MIAKHFTFEARSPRRGEMRADVPQVGTKRYIREARRRRGGRLTLYGALTRQPYAYHGALTRPTLDTQLSTVGNRDLPGDGEP
jgi:hypothetical protein